MFSSPGKQRLRLYSIKKMVSFERDILIPRLTHYRITTKKPQGLCHTFPKAHEVTDIQYKYNSKYKAVKYQELPELNLSVSTSVRSHHHYHYIGAEQRFRDYPYYNLIHPADTSTASEIYWSEDSN